MFGRSAQLTPIASSFPSFKVGKRTNAVAEAFVQDVASRMSNRVQISTDGLKAYVDAIEHSFGGDVDFAQIIKTYGNQEITNNRRYSAPDLCPPKSARCSEALISI